MWVSGWYEFGTLLDLSKLSRGSTNLYDNFERGLDAHIEGDFDLRNPANAVQCPICGADCQLDDILCWNCGKPLHDDWCQYNFALTAKKKLMSVSVRRTIQQSEDLQAMRCNSQTWCYSLLELSRNIWKEMMCPNESPPHGRHIYVGRLKCILCGYSFKN